METGGKDITETTMVTMTERRITVVTESCGLALVPTERSAGHVWTAGTTTDPTTSSTAGAVAVSGLVTGAVLTVRPPTPGTVSAAYTVGTSRRATGSVQTVARQTGATAFSVERSAATSSNTAQLRTRRSSLRNSKGEENVRRSNTPTSPFTNQLNTLTTRRKLRLRRKSLKFSTARRRRRGI